MIRGAQDFWQVGSRILFRRTTDAAKDAWIDFGVIKSIAKADETEKISLEDPAGGVKSVVAEVLTKFTEKYTIVCANFSPDVLAIVFNSLPAESWTQAVTAPEAVNHTVTIGRLHKVHDVAGVNLFNLSSITVTKAGYDVISTDSGTQAIVIAGDHAALYTVGKKIRMSGNSDAASNKQMTVVSSAYSAPNTTITVTAGDVLVGTGDNGHIAEEYSNITDYLVTDLKRGIFRVLTTGTIADAAVVEVAYVTASVTAGLRLINPQTAGGIVNGTAIIELGRGGFAELSYRECDVSVAPTGNNWTADDFSDNTMEVTVLADRTDLVSPAGRLLQAVGDLPALS